MPTQCPACSKVNPADAVYCYYDGRALGQGSQEGPLRLGTMPFPMPFSFSNGQGCSNFNQLALACDERWEEARSLLAEGIWPTFFAAIGRLDLMAAAKQAAKEPDQDVGLSQLLEKFPADANVLRPPKLALPAPEEDLGTLEPGKDHKFEVRISNQGMLVLHGTVATDCDWLSLGDKANASSMKMFQTRNIFNLPARVLGHKLRAGRKPLVGNIVIDTNGGSMALPVRANVPVKPFPKGQYATDALAGAKSPHELAVKAKAHPQEAASLFEQGAVKAWYASNGWTYPIQGTEGTGKGAVQQFFEALGLTKAPKLEISTGRILAKGSPGQKLKKEVTISTKESRFVYAQAWSNQSWIKAGQGKSQGNSITIPLQIEVPNSPGETLHAEVTFQGNGQQRFSVPVTLAVAAAVAEEEDEAEEAAARLPWGWILGGAALVIVVAAAALGFVMNNRGTNGVKPPDIVKGDPQPPAPQGDAWWDSMPDAKLGATMVALRESAPQELALFDSIGIKSDTERYKSYEQLERKLPELARNPKAREPLGRLIVDCVVFEPSNLNLAPLRRALVSQLPRDGAEFRPEEKGEEVSRALWSLQVGFDAMTHKSIRPERVKDLANEFGAVFGFSLDTGAPPDELKTQTEKLLALRCYRNTLPTAARSIDHALTIRALLIEKIPQHLAPAFREKVDVDLVAVGVSKGQGAWPRLEPILKTCLESNDFTTGWKIAGCYGQAPPAVAQQMEGLLAAKWKVASDPKLTQAERVAVIQKTLLGEAAVAKISPAERVARLQKLATSSLAPGKTAAKKDSALLQDTLRLAHAATMACDLFHKGAALARFDELVARVPEIEQTEPGKGGEPTKQPEETKPAAEKGGIAVGAQPKVFNGQLTPASARDPNRNGALCTVYVFALKAGQVCMIDLMTRAFDAFLTLEDPRGIVLAADDDGGVGLNSRIIYNVQADGNYRVIASSLGGRGTGPYTLQIQQAGFGGGRFVPGKRGGFMIGGGKAEGMEGGQETPKTDDKKTSQISQTDLANLESKQSNVRATALNTIAGSVGSDLAPRDAQKIGKYLMTIPPTTGELDEVIGKLESFAKCRHLLLALADAAGNESLTVAQKTAETVVGGILGQALKFNRDEDWRSACRKLLLQRALELTGTGSTSAEQAAETLCDLYKEQGLAFGLEDQEFRALTRPGPALAGIVKHVAGKAGAKNLAAEDKEYLDQIDRHLQAAQFIAENDLEHVVLLQRVWLRVLTIYLQAEVPAQAKGMAGIRDDLAAQDRQAASVLGQLRAGEEKALRIWGLVHNLK